MKKIKNLIFFVITILTMFIFIQNVFANEIIKSNNSIIIPITKDMNIDELFPDLPKDSYFYEELNDKIQNLGDQPKSKNINIPNIAFCIAKTVNPYHYNIFFHNIGIDMIDQVNIKATTTDSYGQYLGISTFREYGVLPGFHRKNEVKYNFRPYIYALIDVQIVDKGKIEEFSFMHYRN